MRGFWDSWHTTSRVLASINDRSSLAAAVKGVDDVCSAVHDILNQAEKHIAISWVDERGGVRGVSALCGVPAVDVEVTVHVAMGLDERYNTFSMPGPFHAWVDCVRCRDMHINVNLQRSIHIAWDADDAGIVVKDEGIKLARVK